MSSSKNKKEQACPHCNKPVDPLRAPAVSVVDGQITYFCSSKCREQFLNRSEKPNETKKEPDQPATDDDSTLKIPSVSPGKEKPPEDRKNKPTQKGYLSSLLIYQLYEVTGFLCLFLVVVFAAPVYGGMLNVALVGASSVIKMVLDILRGRRFGPAHLAEAVGTPIASAIVLASSLFSITLKSALLAAALILLSESIGRLLELLGRRRSGVLAAIEDKGLWSISSSWRDNSEMAARIRRVTLLLEWGRYPLALLIGLAVLFIGSESATAALLSTATALVALNPRALRMATGDTHLATAIAAAEKGIIIRDAHVVDRIARSRIVLFMNKRSLVDAEVKIVDWKLADGADQNKSLTALGTIEAKTEGRIALAIQKFIQSHGIEPLKVEELEIRPPLGVAGNTPYGQVFCGARDLLLNEGISTAMLEPHAKTIEKSGRRALFTVIDGKMVSVFGAEETPVRGAEEAIRQLKHLGREPLLLTSAEVDAAEALGLRLSIENVRFLTKEDDVGTVLGQISEAGDNAVLVGHGPAFEDNLRAATAAVAIGGAKSTQAGVDARGGEIGVVPFCVETAKRAKRSIEINLIAACTATAIGLALAFGWFSPIVVTFAASLGFIAAALSTLNGPYPLWVRVSRRTQSLIKKAKKLTTRRGPMQSS